MTSAPSYYRPAAELPGDAPPLTADLCVYGANAAGVVAAVQARRLGLSVVVLNPARQLGGLTTGGLSFTDLGNREAIGGLAREFYRQLGAHYGVDEEWCFEPHVAERVLQRWLDEAGVEPMHGQYVAQVDCRAGRIVEIATTSGLRVRPTYTIDCSYEGDLMAAAGVSHTIGREGSDTYGEKFNGQQVHASHQFTVAVDPYNRPGDPASGRLFGLDDDDRFIPGTADRRVQAYNFRLCLTREPELRVPFRAPAGYQRDRYELLARYLATGWNQVFRKFDRIRAGKTDVNNHGAVSTDFIGQNWEWPGGDYATRERLFQAHVEYQQGYLWFMTNDPAVPEDIRRAYGQWGLTADEFSATGHWPHQLYIREGRRLVGDLVMTEQHCLSRAAVEDVVGLGAYQMDSHHCRRFVHGGAVLNEGDVQIKLPKPYGISYRAIVPRAGECANLLVPVAVSASHIAFGSIRMEPVFMILAQSAAIAAALCHGAGKRAVQELDYAELRPALERAGQVVAWDAARLNPIDGNPARLNPIG